MTVLAEFFRWFYAVLKKVVESLATLKGVLVSAITSCAAFASSIFEHWSWTSDIVSWIDSATSSLSTLLPSADSEISSVLFGFLALDELAVVAAVLVAATFGVVILVFVTLLSAVLVLVPIVLGVRSTLKSIQTFSGGILNP